MAQMYNDIPATSGNPALGAAAKAFSVDYLKALYDAGGAWKVMRNFTADVANFGESVTLPSFPRLTAVAVDPSDGLVAGDNTQIKAQTVLLDKIYAVNYPVPETTIMQAKIDLKAAFASEAGRAVSDAMDATMSGLCASLTTNSAGSLGSDLDDAAVALALEGLVKNHISLANAAEECVWILPYTQFHAIRALKNYGTNYRIVAGVDDGSKDLKAMIDTIYGIPVIFRTDSSLTVSGGKIGGLFYKDSVGVAIQRMPTMRPIQYIPNSINVALTTWALYGMNLIKEELAVQIKCK